MLMNIYRVHVLTLEDNGPQPFEGKASPFAHLSRGGYVFQIQEWKLRSINELPSGGTIWIIVNEYNYIIEELPKRRRNLH